MITAQLATIPQRGASLRMAIKTLLPQVERLNVMFNGHDLPRIQEIDYEFNNDSLWCFRRSNQMGDAEKFWKVEEHEGYFFTADDDLIYPPDYVQYMIEKIEQYGRKSIVTLHGRNYLPGKIGKYYGSSYRLNTFHCLSTVEGDNDVMLGGTGVMAFHTDTIKVKYSDFQLPNMADLWMAIQAKQQGVTIKVVEHKSGWLGVGYDGEDTIWNKHIDNDSVQTEIYNKYMI
jgi:hypothetical protein